MRMLSRKLDRPTHARIGAALLLAIGLGGCGGGSETESVQPESSQPATSALPAGCSPAAVPDGDTTLMGDPRACKGGTFVMHMNSYPTHLTYYGPEREIKHKLQFAEGMFNTLLEIHPSTLELVPELASSWESEDGGKQLTFHLDPDARWSDGKPITAEDVLFTYDLVMHKSTVEVLLKTKLSAFSRPEILDPHTVRFTADEASWRNILVFADIYIMPKHAIDPESYLEDWRFEVPVVSGPYRLGEYESGKYISLDRRADYWGLGKRWAIGTGNFDKVYLKVIFDYDIAFEHLKKGDLDFFLVIKAQRWAEEMDQEKITKGWIQRAKMYHKKPEVPARMAMNIEHPLFADVRTRKGLFHLYNREYLHDQLFFNQYTNKNSNWANSPYENPDNEKVTFDPNKGLSLLREAGWTTKDADGVLMKDGQRFEFTLLYIHPAGERAYTPIQETFRKYGIKMNLKLISPSAWIKVSEKKEFEMIHANWVAEPFPNPRELWHSEMADRDASYNITRFRNAEVDRLIEAYELEPELQKRIELIQQMDAIIYAEYSYLLDWYSPFFRLLWWDKFGMPEWGSYAIYDARHTVWKTWWYEQPRAERLERARASGESIPLAPPEITYFK